MAADGEKYARHDQLLFTLANQVGSEGIDGLLDAFFSFLRRKTDFFTGGGEGLPRVQTAVSASLMRQAAIVDRDAARKEAAAKAKTSSSSKTAAPKAVGAPSTAAPPPTSTPVLELSSDGTFDARASVVPIAPSGSAMSGAAGGGASGGVSGAAAPTAGNGGRTDRYTWTQTLSDVTIMFPVSAELRSKDVECEIRPQKLSLGTRGGAAPLFSAELPKRVKVDDCSWTMEDTRGGKTVTVILAKDNTMEWWPSVGNGEPEIDLAKIEPENSKLGDLDGET